MFWMRKFRIFIIPFIILYFIFTISFIGKSVKEFSKIRENEEKLEILNCSFIKSSQNDTDSVEDISSNDEGTIEDYEGGDLEEEFGSKYIVEEKGIENIDKVDKNNKNVMKDFNNKDEQTNGANEKDEIITTGKDHLKVGSKNDYLTTNPKETNEKESPEQNTKEKKIDKKAIEKESLIQHLKEIQIDETLEKEGQEYIVKENKIDRKTIDKENQEQIDERAIENKSQEQIDERAVENKSQEQIAKDVGIEKKKIEKESKKQLSEEKKIDEIIMKKESQDEIAKEKKIDEKTIEKEIINKNIQSNADSIISETKFDDDIFRSRAEHVAKAAAALFKLYLFIIYI